MSSNQEIIDLSTNEDVKFIINLEEQNNQEFVSAQANHNTHHTKPDSIRTIYKCCQQEFDDKYEHFDHMLGHMKIVKCYLCEDWFSSDNEMITHCLSQHVNMNSNVIGCHKCRFCKQVLYNKTDLFKHLNTVHNFARNRAPGFKNKRPKRARYWHTESDYVPDYKLFKAKNERKKFWKAKSKSRYAKTEPTYPNVKVEPTFYANVKVEPTSENGLGGPTCANVASIKVEPI